MFRNYNNEIYNENEFDDNIDNEKYKQFIATLGIFMTFYIIFIIFFFTIVNLFDDVKSKYKQILKKYEKYKFNMSIMEIKKDNIIHENIKYRILYDNHIEYLMKNCNTILNDICIHLDNYKSNKSYFLNYQDMNSKFNIINDNIDIINDRLSNITNI
jgi:hypothetical protein